MPFIFNFGGFNPGGFQPGGFDPTQGNGANPFQHKEAKPRKPRKAIGNAFTRVLINLAVTLVVGLVYFYLRLPSTSTRRSSTPLPFCCASCMWSAPLSPPASRALASRAMWAL